jgi:hypothetical protein
MNLRRHLSFANIVAALALLFSMSGGAYAANHYLIHSTKQISPKVLKKLKGNTGKKGATGAAGPRGAAGAAGFSALSTLPSGQSESGEFGARAPGGTAGETVETSASFPIPLALDAPASHVITTKTNTPVTHCSGPGHADQGYVCIYINIEYGINPATEKVFNPEIHPSPGGTGRFGFMMAWTNTAADSGAFGTWTVNAG